MQTAVLVANIRGLHQVLEDHGTEVTVRLVEQFTGITQTVIEQLGGNLVQVWGDEAVVLFRTPQQAVRAALEAHLQYAEVVLPGGRSLGVGIGIAAGKVTWVLTGHVGRPIRRASQLCALAGAGQTFVDTGIREMIPHMHGVAFIERTSSRPAHVNAYTEVAATINGM